MKKVPRKAAKEKYVKPQK